MKPSVWTIGEILQWTKQYFSGKGVDNPRLDAEVLLSHILCQDRLYLYVHYDQPLSVDELAAFRECVRKRAARIPVAYIIGEKEFFGLPFLVSPAVLIPRPETELLVEAVVRRLAGKPKPQIVDLGTGSGAITVSLLTQLPDAAVVAVDISAAALEVARTNAKRHGVEERVEWRQGDFWRPVTGLLFDAIVSNPPYIPAEDVHFLSQEVKNEPILALDGGKDGLEYYRRLLAEGDSYLASDGFMAVEIGINQAAAIRLLAEQSPFAIQEVCSDYAGIERIVVLTRRKAS